MNPTRHEQVVAAALRVVDAEMRARGRAVQEAERAVAELRRATVANHEWWMRQARAEVAKAVARLEELRPLRVDLGEELLRCIEGRRWWTQRERSGRGDPPPRVPARVPSQI